MYLFFYQLAVLSASVLLKLGATELYFLKALIVVMQKYRSIFSLKKRSNAELNINSNFFTATEFLNPSMNLLVHRELLQG